MRDLGVFEHSATLKDTAARPCRDAVALVTEVRERRTERAAQVQGSAFRRVFRLARGANDKPIETRMRKCPHCLSEAMTPAGRVAAVAGMVKVLLHLKYVRAALCISARPRDGEFGPRRSSPASP
jgi:hypothetical protein